jgi:LacI family sucrose operon transcriptional repressor
MATLKDVAEEAGLAVSTVSRIMNNRGYISDQARKKVDDAIKKLNYQPNELARSLHRKNTNMIGLIVPHVRHPYFAEVISNLEYQARKKGYRLLLSNSQGIVEQEKECVDMCTSNRVAGIIICTGGISLEKVQDTGVPIIGFERHIDCGMASVECDNIQGGRMAAETLIKNGCRHILHVGDIIGEAAMPADQRKIGFQQVCDEEGIDYRNVYFDKKSYDTLSYGKLIEEAMKVYPQVDGVFANSDLIAAQVLQACRKLNISVPDQIKVVGFDDVNIASLTAPLLTTIHQPIEEMAEITIQLLDDAAAGKVIPKRTVLPVKLIERESV